MVSADRAGNYEPHAVNIEVKKGAAAIAMGDVLQEDTTTNTFRTAPATAGIAGPFAVAIKSALAADTIVAAGIRGIFYLTADGTINPGRYVTPSATTAGRVVQYVPATGTTPTGAEVTAAAIDTQRIVGLYLGKVDENDGKTAPSAATAGDIIRVRFGV